MQAGRGQFYAQSTLFTDLAAPNHPFICTVDTLLNSSLMKTKNLTISGVRISDIANEYNITLPMCEFENSSVIEEIAKVGSKLSPTNVRPEPLYLRKADAKPQTQFAVERVI